MKGEFSVERIVYFVFLKLFLFLFQSLFLLAFLLVAICFYFSLHLKVSYSASNLIVFIKT